MFVRTTKIELPMGLHAKNATFFVQRANTYKCSIWLEKSARRVNAKSLLGILAIGINNGDSFAIRAEGKDEVQAVNELVDLIEKKELAVIS